jgi:ribonuclease D
VEAKDVDPANVVLLGNLLGVVLADLCARKKLAANLVASGSDLKAVVRSTALTQPLPDIPLTRGWRGEVILPELHAILHGRHGVRVAKPSSSAPLAYLALEREVDPAPAAGPDAAAPKPVLPPESDVPDA